MGRGGVRDPGEYIYITAEVFYDPERRVPRVRPISGQPFPINMRIECSKSIHELPLGTKVRLRVVETEKEGSRKFLYSSYRWPYELVK